MVSKGVQMAQAANARRAEIKKQRNGSSLGTVIAEGDSWIEYPLGNLRTELEAIGWDIFSVAHNGDRLEEMAYDMGQQEKLARAFEKVAADGKDLRAVLVSAGGNDVVGDFLAVLLNHAASGLEPLNERIMTGQFDRLVEAFQDLFDAITEHARFTVGKVVPIVVHGYDYPVPSGEGFLSGFGPLPGPWLRPGFERRGYPAKSETSMWKNHDVLRTLIDRWNERLQDLCADTGVHYVDLRNTLTKPRWKDELHADREGFGLLAQKVDAKLKEVA